MAASDDIDSISTTDIIQDNNNNVSNIRAFFQR